MAGKRVKLKQKELDELLESLRWCEANEFIGLGRFYRELLGEHEARRTLPQAADQRADGDDRERVE